MNTLFDMPTPLTQDRDRVLDQFFTPQWAATALVEEFFPDLTGDDLVLEPSCGRGAFLQAIPSHVPAFGVEIDEQLAEEVRSNTGRSVLCGDFRTLAITQAPTVIVGNPPFDMQLFDGFLERAAKLLPDNGRCGFLLPAYTIQTPSRVLKWNDRWSLAQKALPRTLFPGSQLPLIFLMFAKDGLRRLDGFCLYRAIDEVKKLPAAVKLLLIHGEPRKPCWRAVVEWALRKIGGKGSLRQLYDAIEPHRPTDNRYWQEKVRQILQRYFTSHGGGVWAL